MGEFGIDHELIVGCEWFTVDLLSSLSALYHRNPAKELPV